MIRAVLDTVIFVRGLLNPRSIWGRLVFDRADDYRLVMSQPLLDEVLDVLGRPAVTRKFRYVAGLGMSEMLAILAKAEYVTPAAIEPISRDPKDDKFLATAEAAGAAYLVTEDEDLLVLGIYGGVRIVTAAAFLAILDAARDASSSTGG